MWQDGQEIMNTTFKKILLGAVVTVSTLALSATAALANNGSLGQSLVIDNSGNAAIVGNVASVSGSTLGVSSWGGTWSVNVANATFLPENTSGLSAIKVGDTVKVSGTITSGMSITAKKVMNKSINVPMIEKDGDNKDHGKFEGKREGWWKFFKGGNIFAHFKKS